MGYSKIKLTISSFPAPNTSFLQFSGIDTSSIVLDVQFIQSSFFFVQIDTRYLDVDYSQFNSLNGIGVIFLTSKLPNSIFSPPFNQRPGILVEINNVPFVSFTPQSTLLEKHYFQYLNLNGDYKTRLLTYDSANKIFHLPEINEEFFITDVFINSVKCSYIRLSYDSIEMEAYINTINKQYKPNKYSFIPAYTVFTMSNLTPVISSSFTSTSIATPVNISSKMQDNPDYQFLSALVTSPEHKFFSKLGTIEIYPLASQIVSLVGTKFSPSRQVLYYCTTSVIACTCTLNFDDAANTFVPAVGVKSVFQQISSATTFVTGFVAVCTPF